jgi:hypothetical protein
MRLVLIQAHQAAVLTLGALLTTGLADKDTNASYVAMAQAGDSNNLQLIIRTLPSI